MRTPRKFFAIKMRASNHRRVDECLADEAMEPQDVFLIRRRIHRRMPSKNLEASLSWRLSDAKRRTDGGPLLIAEMSGAEPPAFSPTRSFAEGKIALIAMCRRQRLAA